MGQVVCSLVSGVWGFFLFLEFFGFVFVVVLCWVFLVVSLFLGGGR